MPSELNNYYRPEPAIGKSEKGSANGVATLDGSGLVPSNQLPSYVDDVLEFASLSNFPETGEIGKIYVAIDTNKSYRWSGSTYVELSAYALATQAAAGLMSAADKTKLDGVTAGAEPNPGDATQQASGLMSATDKAKLDGIDTGATAVIVSNSLSDTSTTKALSAAKGKALNDQIETHGYSATVNGITYIMYENMGWVIISATSGTCTNAVTAGDTLVALADFNSSFSSKKFQFAVFATVITYSGNRVVANGNSNTVQASQGYSAGNNPRFTLVGYIA